MKKIAIVIPTFNRRDLLRDLLQQLYSIEQPKADISIIVVVDGSNDGTLEMLQAEFPRVHSVLGSGNWWYTRSMNEGFKYAKNISPDYVLTLNDDIKLKNNYLEKIVEAINHVPNGSIIGSIAYTSTTPHLLLTSGVKDIVNWKFKLVTYHKPFASNEMDSLTGIHPSKVLPGRGILIPFYVLEKLNYFDEKFAQYHSDFDFCLRAAKLGFKSYISWDAVIYSYVDNTAKISSFLKASFKEFIKSFFDNHSRIYLPDNARFLFRHGIKILFPVSFFIFIAATFNAHFFKKKIL